MTARIEVDRLVDATLLASAETHASLGSTNDRAKRAAAESPPLPRLVHTAEQTSGRGRGANRWWSAPGALTFSLLIDPKQHGLAPGGLGAVSIATALAVCDAIEHAASIAASIKWPNDVLVGDKKVAGLLLEAPAMDRLVIGIGLNLNNRFEEAPGEVRRRAASLAECAGRELETQPLMLELLRRFERRLNQIRSQDPTLPADWNLRCALTGREVSVESGGETIRGRCEGLGPGGELLLREGDRVRRVVSGIVLAIG